MSETTFTSTQTGRKLTAAEKQAVDEIKTIGEHLLAAIDRAEKSTNGKEAAKTGHNGEEFSIARMNVRQGVMWAVKGVTK